MEWYYAQGTTKIGPLSDEAFQQLIHSGLIKADTLVWHSNMSDWESYGALSGLDGHLPGQPTIDLSTLTTRNTCSECGKPYLENEVIPFESDKICPECRPRFINKITEGMTLTGLVAFASLYARFLAKLADFIFLAIFLLLIAVPVWIFSTPFLNGVSPSTVRFFIGFTIVMAYILYHSFLIARFGATPGKILLGLRVIMKNGDPPSFKSALIRSASEIISMAFLGGGYLMACFDNKKRTFHDYTGNTRVILQST